MGTGASFLHTAAKEDPDLLANFRNQYANIFTEEFEKLKNQDLSAKEVQAQFEEALKNREPEILASVAAEEIADTKKSSKWGTGARTNDDAEFKGYCEDKADLLIMKAQHTFVCCVDGSDSSDLAFKVAMNFKGRNDNLCVFHAFKGAKQAQLPVGFHPAEIRKKYERSLVGTCPPGNFSFHFEERYTRTALDTLRDSLHFTSTAQDAVAKLNLPPHSIGMTPDFVILGHTGRKGPRSKPSSLGSTADLALRTITLPCIIAKTSPPRSTRVPRAFAMAVNFSECSKRGLDILLQLVRPRDSLKIIFICRPDVEQEAIDSLRTYYEEELHNNAPVNSDFVVIHIHEGADVAEALVDYCNGPHSPDFFALAPRAKADALSAVTEFVIQNSRTSIILCKN